MDNRMATLQFSNEGKEVTVVFANSKESLESYNSKRTAYAGIIEMWQASKINEDEYIDLSKQILLAKKLPDVPPTNSKSDIAIIMVTVCTPRMSAKKQ